jgi:hypothetical protein
VFVRVNKNFMEIEDIRRVLDDRIKSLLKEVSNLCFATPYSDSALQRAVGALDEVTRLRDILFNQ